MKSSIVNRSHFNQALFSEQSRSLMTQNYVFPCFIQPSNKLQMLVIHCSMFLPAFFFLISGNSEFYREDGMMGEDLAEKQITLCISCIFSYQTPKLT